MLSKDREHPDHHVINCLAIGGTDDRPRVERWSTHPIADVSSTRRARRQSSSASRPHRSEGVLAVSYRSTSCGLTGDLGAPSQRLSRHLIDRLEQRGDSWIVGSKELHQAAKELISIKTTGSEHLADVHPVLVSVEEGLEDAERCAREKRNSCTGKGMDDDVLGDHLMKGGVREEEIDWDPPPHQANLTVVDESSQLRFRPLKGVGQCFDDVSRSGWVDEDVEVDVCGRPRITSAPGKSQRSAEGVGKFRFLEAHMDRHDGIDKPHHRGLRFAKIG